MVKCRVCAWRICATCHNLEMRGESTPSPPEIRHPDHGDHDNEMPEQLQMMRCYETMRPCTFWRA